MFTLAMMTAMTAAPATPQFDGFFRDLFHGDCRGSCNGNGSSRAANTDTRGSCSGSCHGGLFHGGIRNFFDNVFDGRSCHGNGRRPLFDRGNDRSNDREPYREPYREPIRDPGYGRAPISSGCMGSGVYAGSGCTGGGYASGPVYLGSCFGSTPSSGCFGGGGYDYAPGGFGGGGYDYATPSPAGFGGGCCECGGAMGTVGGLPGGGYPGGSPALPPLGSPLQDYNPIPNPNVPLPRNMPAPGNPFDNPARPEEAGGGVVRFKKPLTDTDDEQTRGRVVVKLPVGAKVWVEGRPLSITDGERTFVTPPLPTDRAAVYSFKVEFTRDGDDHSQSKKVTVRAGETTRLELTDIGLVVKADAPTRRSTPDAPITAPADPRKLTPEMPTGPTNPTLLTKNAKPDDAPTVKAPNSDVAKITVKLPAGAVLFVNGGKNARTEAVREFTTPSLVPGKVYAYTMRAETTRDGLPEYQESKVEFRAGDTLTVDFTGKGELKAAK